jgi:hypothetical protein
MTISVYVPLYLSGNELTSSVHLYHACEHQLRILPLPKDFPKHHPQLPILLPRHPLDHDMEIKDIHHFLPPDRLQCQS